MTGTDPRLAAPIDAESAERLAGRGLRYGLVGDDDAALDAWCQALARGFHDERPDANEERAERARAWFRRQRVTGVWPEGATMPVATTSSWITPLALPGGAPIEMWSISAVTVAATHAGMGIARALLEGELRTAAAAGLAVAGLTVSESTLYGRYGFGIATQAASLEFDATRVRWAGPEPELALEFVDVATAAADFERLHAEQAAATPGDARARHRFWHRATGADEPDRAETRKRRFVRALAGGEPVGIAMFTLERDESDFTHHILAVRALAAPGVEARAALWRFLLSQPLVRTVTAELIAPDDPVRWWIGDWRGLRQRIEDHQWLRVLDAPRALAARGYAARERIALAVDDDLGFAAGELVLDARAESPAVERVEGTSAEPLRLELGASALASLWLGAFSASALAAAGLVRGDAASIAAADRLFAVARAPFLSTWY